MSMAPYFQLVGLNCRFTHSCLGLYYVREGLGRRFPGTRIDIDQLTINDPYYDTLLKISGSGAEAVFFSVYIWNGTYVHRLVHDLVRIEPDRPIVLGGPQAAFLGDLPGGCTIVRGEFEGIGEDFYRDLEAGELQPEYSAGPAPSFPFPYRGEDFGQSLQNRTVYYESSRGCPFRCSYCLSSVTHRVCHKDIETVCRELSEILAHAPRIIKFVDRTFNDDHRRTLAIWDFLAGQEGRTMFHFEIAPDRFSEEMFALLERVGPDRFQFEIGIQSTNPATLAAVNRQMDVEQAAANIRRLVRMDNIHLHVDLILGLPFETEERFLESFSRVFLLEPHYIQMGLLKVLPETPLSKQQEEFKMISCRQPPYEILANRWLEHRQVNRLHRFCECVESFYNNRYFRSIWAYLVVQGEEPAVFFQALLDVCEEHGFFDLSATQELLARMLALLARQREDGRLLMELLRHDWLRCGHRFLPSFLEERPLADLRRELRRTLPPSMEGLYDARSRGSFLKQGVFLELSGAALDQLKLEEGSRSGVACFFPDQTGGVIKHSRVGLIEGACEEA